MKVFTLLIAISLAGLEAFAQYNTFKGTYAGYSNTTGMENTFIGYSSGHFNTTKSYNTFCGYQSGYQNTGKYNVLLGVQSGKINKGDHNIFVGNNSGSGNEGDLNIFLGRNTGIVNEGHSNIFFGYSSGKNNQTGGNNIFLGAWTGNNVTGSGNISIGYAAGQTSNNLENSIAIGSYRENTASNQILFGNTNTTSIGGQVGWSVLSDGRFKKNIKENVAGLDFIKELHPVSYEIDIESLNKFQGLDTVSFTDAPTTAIVTTGFIAQDVDDLVKENNYAFYGVEAPQNEKDNYTIRYTEFVVPLVKAVQELSNIVENQQEKITRLRAALPDDSDMSGILNRVQLNQNLPNPFTSATSIEMFLPGDITQAEVHIIDIDGKILHKIPVSERGNTSITLEKGTLKNGVYIYSLVVDGNVAQSKRLILAE